MYLKIPPSLVGSSTSQETPADNHFTHHQGRIQGVPREVEEEERMEVGEVIMGEVEVEAEEEYPDHTVDQACSHRMGKLLTFTNSSVANLNCLQETGQKSNPSSHNGNCTAGLTQTTRRCKINTKR
jgi:hypothetical protein